jgi:hypothetical protein
MCENNSATIFSQVQAMKVLQQPNHLPSESDDLAGWRDMVVVLSRCAKSKQASL